MLNIKCFKDRNQGQLAHDRNMGLQTVMVLHVKIDVVFIKDENALSTHY